ncbi:glycosyltransferase family 4 protein [Sphingobacterium kitahiroshimense]|uniref:Glycosyltransferase family 4 protein n=1 Tax=Sphingobacterium kitahiroshimense TaxID=470446 RepID=A0ABV0C0Y3_9SPHI
MKILLVNNTIFYEENYELFLNKETGNFFLKLSDLGNDVSAFQISQLKTEKDTFANFRISNKEIKIYDVKRRKSRILPFLKSFFVIQKAIIKNDFIYVFYPGPICKVICILCILYRKPFGLYVRGEQGISTSVSKFILKRATNIFTISPKFTQSILAFNKRVNTIRPMIGFTEEDVVSSRNINLAEKIELLYVGRLVYDKGLFELIDALEVLVKRGRNIFLNLVGGGTDYESLIKVVNDKDLSDRVKFHGMISAKEDLEQMYKSCNVFVLPTYHEGFPRVLYEAMIMRIPILTTFVGTINFLMKDGDNCLEIKPKSVNSIVENIDKLISNPVLAQNIADNGANTIIEYLDDKKMDHSEQLNNNLLAI